MNISNETGRWLHENAGKEVKLTEKDKERLFGPQGGSRNLLIKQFLEYRKQNRAAGVFCYQVRPEAVDFLIEFNRTKIDKKHEQVNGMIMSNTGKLMEAGADMNTAANIVKDVFEGRLRLSDSTRKLISEGKKRWSAETLALMKD